MKKRKLLRRIELLEKELAELKEAHYALANRTPWGTNTPPAWRPELPSEQIPNYGGGWRDHMGREQ